MLKVMSGDVIDLAVKLFYAANSATLTTPSFTDVLNSVANGMEGAASGAKGSFAELSNQAVVNPLFNALYSYNTTNSQPVAGR